MYPPVLPIYKGLDPPPGYVQKRTFNRSLLWSGGALLLVTYGITLGYSASNGDQEGASSLAVPILGPWLALGRRKFSCPISPITITGIQDIEEIQRKTQEAQDCWAEQVKVGAIFTGLGVGQLVGSLILAAGFIDQKRYWLRADLDTVSIRLDPLSGPGLTGFVASGTF